MTQFCCVACVLLGAALCLTAGVVRSLRYVMEVIQRGRTAVRPALFPPLSVVPAVSDSELSEPEYVHHQQLYPTVSHHPVIPISHGTHTSPPILITGRLVTQNDVGFLFVCLFFSNLHWAFSVSNPLLCVLHLWRRDIMSHTPSGSLFKCVTLFNFSCIHSCVDESTSVSTHSPYHIKMAAITLLLHNKGSKKEIMNKMEANNGIMWSLLLVICSVTGIVHLKYSTRLHCCFSLDGCFPSRPEWGSQTKAEVFLLRQKCCRRRSAFWCFSVRKAFSVWCSSALSDGYLPDRGGGEAEVCKEADERQITLVLPEEWSTLSERWGLWRRFRTLCVPGSQLNDLSTLLTSNIWECQKQKKKEWFLDLKEPWWWCVELQSHF